MSIKTNKSYKQIGESLKIFNKDFNIDEFPYLLLSSIGASDTVITRYKNGKNIVKTFDGFLVKKIFAYKRVSTNEMFSSLEKMNSLIVNNKPPIIAVSDGKTILAFDTIVKETYENEIRKLYTDYSFFSPIWGVKKLEIIEEKDVDVEASIKMAKIHDEIRRFNEIGINDDIHDLNVFMSRLLFCFFAEDTGIFEHKIFTKTLVETTENDESDLQEFLMNAFTVMDLRKRNEVNSIYLKFPYVNGGLFTKRIQVPRLNFKIRDLIKECGTLNWGKINPDIFGSMIQAVINPELRSGMGIHYTSVSNIKKLINPLFLDELYDEFYKLDRKKREHDVLAEVNELNQKSYDSIIKDCKSFLKRISNIKFFDPACGSGNFLIIIYKELRKLESSILKLIKSMDPNLELNFIDGSYININQFYGIELNDFAHETAILSLWLAEHQMNRRFIQDFGVNIKALPLKSNNNIICNNACKISWKSVCSNDNDEEVYIVGNPPYLGSRNQNSDQKSDMKLVFPKNSGSLDLICAWFYKAAEYIENTKSSCAFVSTNSICQGLQVSLLWNSIFKFNVNIPFAYTSFKWENNAKYNAGVTVVIIGLSSSKKYIKKIYSKSNYKEVKYISPYLTADSKIIVSSQNSSISGFPKMNFGNMPADDGLLLFNEEEKNRFIEKDSRVAKYIKPLISSRELLHGETRYCLWLNNVDIDEVRSIPIINERIMQVHNVRLNSSRPQLAEFSHLFAQITQQTYFDFIIIPRTTSEHRKYIPISYVVKESIAHDTCMTVSTKELWLFGVLTSLMHMVWVKAIGGRLKTDLRYSAKLCYNTFPFPKISKAKKQEIEIAVRNLLEIRENYYEFTLADIYDSKNMPEDLKEAHNKLDIIIDTCYQKKPFSNNQERLTLLLKKYEKMINIKK